MSMVFGEEKPEFQPTHIHGCHRVQTRGPLADVGVIELPEILGRPNEVIQRSALPAGAAVLHGLRERSPVRRDDGRAAELGLDGHVAERFGAFR
jgi:hypothetical protein